MSVAQNEILTWILWIAAGIVCGLVAAGLGGGRRMLVYDLVVGIVLSILGGWCSAVFAGDAVKSQLIVSVLCSTLLSGLGVYILNKTSRRR